MKRRIERNLPQANPQLVEAESTPSVGVENPEKSSNLPPEIFRVPEPNQRIQERFEWVQPFRLGNTHLLHPRLFLHHDVLLRLLADRLDEVVDKYGHHHGQEDPRHQHDECAEEEGRKWVRRVRVLRVRNRIGVGRPAVHRDGLEHRVGGPGEGAKHLRRLVAEELHAEDGVDEADEDDEDEGVHDGAEGGGQRVDDEPAEGRGQTCGESW
mmetsp:Transcript_54182/g.143345  ORF Transcript_54182/g.143345 Transcript_54182/m.143345 type:complete len:211 (+) Transcript_54182:1511-2143(+)